MTRKIKPSKKKFSFNLPNKLIDSYKSLCTEFYDLDKPSPPEDALEYYLNEAKNCTQPALEPMCGSGRFLIPMMEQGIDIEGTDASEKMLESCRNKCRGKNLSPVLYYQKIQELKLYRKYGLVFIPSGSFGLNTEDNDVRESLKRIHDCLLPEGKFILEIEPPAVSTHEEIIKQREVIRDDASKILLTSKTQFKNNPNSEVISFEYQSIVNGELISAEREIIKVRHYRICEFADLLTSAGFCKIEALKPYRKIKAADNDEMILFSCVRPG